MALIGACPLCGSEKAVTLFRVPDRLHGTPGIFIYERCNKCKTVYQNPRVVAEDLELCYPTDYYTHARSDCRASHDHSPHGGLSSVRSTVRDAIRAAVRGRPVNGFIGWISRILATNRWLRERAFYDEVPDELIPRDSHTRRALEIGCGSGSLMAAPVRAGWEVEGVEWDPSAARAAREMSGRPVWDGDFRRADLPEAAYDLVVLSHVIEHLDDPLSALRRIRDILVPGGRAVLYYPNTGALGARLYGREWIGWEPPRHLVIPPLRAFASCARRVGLVPVGVGTSCRHSVGLLSYSRALKEGRSVIFSRLEIGVADRLLGSIERLLVCLGLPLGEEAVVELKRPDCG